MWSFCFLLCSICVVSRVLSAPAESSSSTVRCYDCHYDPGALKQTDDGNWSGTGSGGFPRCALKNYDDPDFLNKYGCTKGKCFIRKDPNGQVFRGCADPWNLPWGVDTNSNCHKQNDKSVWWFCDGELCNDGAIDDDKRCEDLPKLEKKDKEPAYQQEEESYQHEEQNVYQPNYYQEDYGTEYKEPSTSISVTVEHKDDDSNSDSSSVSGYEAENSPSLPAETVYDLNDDKGKDVYNADSNSNDVGYGNSNNNDNIYYSRTQGRYISYESDGPAHYYTDSELSYNTDRNYNTYDYVLPDDYGRTTEYNTVEEPVEPVPELYYPDTYAPEDDITVPVNDDYYPESTETDYYPESTETDYYPENRVTGYDHYPENTETGYEDSEYKGDGATIDGGGYYGEGETYYSYDEPAPTQEKPDNTENYESHIPENWYYREEAELASHHLPHGWHPFPFPWFHGYHYSGDSSAAAKDTEDTSYDQKISWNGQPYIPEDSEKQPTKNQYEPKKSHEPAPKKSHYEPPKKSHPTPPKKSTYVPQKKSHEPTPKKSHYQPPKKSHYVPPKKSHDPAPKKSHYVPPKKSHDPPPKKSYPQPPKKSHDPPPKKSYPQPKKSPDPPPKKSYPQPKKSHDPPPKKSHQPQPKKSHDPPPKKSYQPPPKKSEPPKKSHDPPPKKSHPPPKKSYEPPPKSQPPKGKYQPPAKSGAKKSVSPKKVFEPEETQPARSENTVYTLGDNLQVLGNTLIHVDDDHQDGVNAYAEVDHDNVDNYGREFDDNDAVYYEYDYELDPQTDANVVGYDSNAGTGDLYDPNSLTDDTAYYYEYSHEYPGPSESVQNLCSGTCGLYPHPEKNKQFVQCGPGVHYGQTCDCCQAYEHKCPDGTSFDAYIGVCSQGSDSSYDHASYKSVDYY